MKTNCICKYLDTQLKMYIHHALSELNISPNDALEIYYKYIEHDRGLPVNLISTIKKRNSAPLTCRSDDDEWDECI